MEQLMINARPYLEALYFLSGLLVAIVALYALRQVRLMKMDMLARSERAAKEKAIEAVYQFVKIGEIYCRCAKLYEQDTARTYSGPIGNFSDSSIPSEHKEMAEKRFKNRTMGQPLNQLDVIAATFVTGVADEKTAFTIFGGAFCAAVAGQYDFICMARAMSRYAPYSSIIKLYNTWSTRLTKEDLKKEREELDTQIRLLPDKEFPPLSPMPEKRI